MTTKKTETARRRIWNAHRTAVIAALGWEAEPEVCDPGERYAATCGELLMFLREIDPMRAAVLCAAVLVDLKPWSGDCAERMACRAGAAL